MQRKQGALPDYSIFMAIAEDIGYDASKLLTNLKNKLAISDFRTEEEKSDTLQKLEMYLYQNGYLRTTR